MLLPDKVVVVAGVGSGLGRSIALASAREGADVVLAARTAARLDEVAKEVAALGRRGLAVPTDLADAEAVERLAADRDTTSSAGWTRWSTTRWRCRRSRSSARSAWTRCRPASTPTSSPRSG